MEPDAEVGQETPELTDEDRHVNYEIENIETTLPGDDLETKEQT
jgi:hypothetical protein